MDTELFEELEQNLLEARALMSKPKKRPLMEVQRIRRYHRIQIYLLFAILIALVFAITLGA